MDIPLEEQLTKLKEILAALRSTSFWDSLPILDETRDRDAIERQESDLPGLKNVKFSIQKEIETIETHLAMEANGNALGNLSTNSTYYFAFWNECLKAPRPIVALGRTFPIPEEARKVEKSGKKSNGNVKVDIVADGGNLWLRVNTTKESRLLAEFRGIEAFSYDSDEEDEEDNLAEETGVADGQRPRLPLETYLENTVYETGLMLSLAAQEFSVSNGYTPKVHMRLTRLDPSVEDERIRYTIDKLSTFNVSIQQGPNDAIYEATNHQPVTNYMPHHINLDLSLLIALVTDITHSPLPATFDDADVLFRPQTERSWKRQMEKHPLSSEDALEHCRALAEQTKDEMEHGIVDRIWTRLQEVPGKSQPIFWTSEEARSRFLAIIEKIGGPDELRRAQALFRVDDSAEEDYWRGSRIPSFRRPNFVPIHILSDDSSSTDPDLQPQHPFHQQVATTCRSILKKPVRPELKNDDPSKLIPAPVRFAARLSAHTVQSLLLGAEGEMVTLTSNKTSIRSLLREMRGYALPAERGTYSQTESTVPLALWIVEPRSLSQGMRSDFTPV
ncbi:hypothetical protein FRC17_010438 [Serendipita sp. 399]|nr:hypothetical protein FRC17_010438 [Serendipita sp. 399]